MILAGDIGGTKTVLALYSREGRVSNGALHQTRFESCKYTSLEAIITEFLRETGARPLTACFGVAGPVIEQKAKITNLPWTISAENISRSFEIDKVFLLNDLEAIAMAVQHLEDENLATLNRGEATANGNIAVIAAGTGLGVAFLVWTGSSYKACASEGGHTSFSPQNRQQTELFKYLQQRYDHVSFERICSGSYLPNIYDFLLDQGNYPEPLWLQQELARVDDRTPTIVQTALDHKAEICEASLDMFVHVLGTMISNIAVTLLPLGGIYLGGGIPPRILARLQKPDFLSAICNKGRFSQHCADMPVHVILNPGVALDGAARHALSLLDKHIT